MLFFAGIFLSKKNQPNPKYIKYLISVTFRKIQYIYGYEFISKMKYLTYIFFIRTPTLKAA